MPTKKKREPITFNLNDDRYDKPVRYLKRHRAYLTTLQDKTRSQPGLYDVTPEHGDRAVPKGIVQVKDGMALKGRLVKVYGAFLYHPSYSGNLLYSIFIDDYSTLDDAISAVLER